MSDLEDKLKGIVAEASTIGAGMDNFGALPENEQAQQVDGAVAEILDAFKQAGYLQVKHLSRPEAFDMTNDVLYITPTLMTPQEFYDRFDKELEQAAKGVYADEIDYSLVAVHNYASLVREAARKAAGLE